MLVNPRYGGEPVLTLDGPPAAIREPAIRQRQRLSDLVPLLTDDDWAHPSRCDGWSNRDVINHLDTVNGFWVASIKAGLAGEATELLATFDPSDTPDQLVGLAAELTTAQVLDGFLASNQKLIHALEALDDDGWTATAEAPPGHVSIAVLAHHALWDSWVHERDIAVPLGRTVAEEPDEIAAGLRYATALGPALRINRGDDRTGRLGVAVADPAVEFTVEVGESVAVRAGSAADADAELGGDAVTVLEAVSRRATLPPERVRGATWLVDLEM